MKLQELFHLAEARDPELKYVDKRIKGKLEAVTVELSGNQSGKFTRISREYARLKKATEKLAEKRDALNVKIKEEVEGLYEAEDEIYTRVVETCSMTMTLSKKTISETSKTDYEAIIAKLTEMVPELTDQINDLVKEFTTVKPVEKSPALRVTVKEGLELGDLKKLAKAFFSKIKTWARSYDRKLKSIEKSIDKL